MHGLADVRLLVLVGAQNGPDVNADLDLLDRRTTAHRLPFFGQQVPTNMLRLLKRLVLGQDDIILLYGANTFLLLLVALTTMPFRGRVIGVRIRQQRGFNGALWKRFGLVQVSLASKKGPAREEALLKGIALVTGRKWDQARTKPLRIDLGCGSLARPGFVGIDARSTPATAIVADARSVAVGDHLADEVYASCLLEHFENPHEVLREIHRILASDGQAVLRLPNLGTYSSHLDLTHRFLADLTLWRRILSGYFHEVTVVPVGTKYRDSSSLVAVNWFLVNVLKWYELAQGWDFVCRGPKAEPSVEYVAWWEE
jgi:hypothetical protein